MIGPDIPRPRDFIFEQQQWKDFAKSISFLPELEQLDILAAYELAQDMFSTVPDRKTKERFFEHLRQSTIIMADSIRETGFYLRDLSVARNLIIGELFHDAIEDTDYFSRLKGKVNPTHEERMMDAYLGLSMHDLFRGTFIADWVHAISEPLSEKLTGQQTTKKQHSKLRKMEREGTLSPESLLLKIPDRTHNLSTPYNSEKHQRKIDETREFYLPLFDKVLQGDPVYGDLYANLRSKLQVAMQFEEQI